MSDPAMFAELNAAIDGYLRGGREPNSALLLWFLVHVQRFDVLEAEDAICDGPGDKGIDGLWVDGVTEEIGLLQGKRRVALTTTQGDSDIAKLVGAASWLSSPEQVDALLAAGPNAELRGLVERNDVRAHVAEGYAVRCVFVTNSVFDASGSGYLSAHASGPPPLDGWDLVRLEPYVRFADRPLFIEETIQLTFAPEASFGVDLPDESKVLFGALPAKQIAELPGIEDRTLFAQNVRLGLGKTRVNKDIRATLSDAKEHPTFLAFHNGLTIVCKELEVDGSSPESVRITGFSMVNGCQSAVLLHENEAAITDDLMIPVRLVQVGNSTQLADDITYRSNNQNAINLKDLRANDPTQVALQAEFKELYGDKVEYEIKRGETLEAERSLPNDLAAQILLALYNEQPWLSHRKFDLFDQRYKEVFHPRIKAAHIYFAYLIYQLVQRRLRDIEDQLIANYGLTSFVLVYVAGLLLRETDEGRNLLDDPQPVLEADEALVRERIDLLLGDLVVDFNFYVREKLDQDGYFDYKTSFKNQRAVLELSADVVRSYKKDITRDAGRAFTLG